MPCSMGMGPRRPLSISRLLDILSRTCSRRNRRLRRLFHSWSRNLVREPGLQLQLDRRGRRVSMATQPSHTVEARPRHLRRNQHTLQSKSHTCSTGHKSDASKPTKPLPMERCRRYRQISRSTLRHLLCKHRPLSRLPQQSLRRRTRRSQHEWPPRQQRPRMRRRTSATHRPWAARCLPEVRREGHRPCPAPSPRHGCTLTAKNPRPHPQSPNTAKKKQTAAAAVLDKGIVASCPPPPSAALRYQNNTLPPPSCLRALQGSCFIGIRGAIT